MSFEGVGIHTGRAGKVTVHPAPENSGRVFRSPEGVEIPARVDYVVDCSRSTILGKDSARVHTTEHLLSAMVAAGVDNALIEMSGPEVPILDGSAKSFFEAIQSAGVELQASPARTIKPEKPISVSGPKGEIVLIVPRETSEYEYVLHYDHPMLGTQVCSFLPQTGDYAKEIAPARTFALWEEVQVLLERGLAQGGSLDNALVVYQDKYSTPLTVEQEPVRHKCLDLIGDFALLDARLQAKILAVKAGHRWHVECAKLLWEEMAIVESA